MNYDPIIIKIQNVLDRWSNRDISLIGKVNVVNTLVASLLVYKMKVLPNIPKDYVRKIENLITSFIWNKRKPKISIKVLQMPKKEGGLGLVDIVRKEVSIKISWLKILEQNEKVAKLAYYFICPIVKADIWHCNLHKQDIKKYMKIKNSFWEDVLVSWSEYHFDTEIFEKQTVWYNSHIRVQNKPVMWKKYYDKGLLWVEQVYKSGTFVGFKLMEEQFQMNFIDFLSIKEAIVASGMTTQAAPDTLTEGLTVYEKCITKSNITRYIYSQLGQSSPQNLIRTANTWSTELLENISEIELLREIKHVYVCTNIVKLRSFQYRLLNRALVTNIQLKKWKIRGDDRCTFCNIYQETYVHLFYECIIVNHIWQQIKEQMLSENCVVNTRNVICNKVNYVKTKSVDNLVCLVFKQYVYMKRCFNEQLCFNEFRKSMYKIRNIENYNAIVTGNVRKCQQKWCNTDKNPLGSQPQCQTQTSVNSIDEYILEYVNNV